MRAPPTAKNDPCSRIGHVLRVVGVRNRWGDCTNRWEVQCLHDRQRTVTQVRLPASCSMYATVACMTAWWRCVGGQSDIVLSSPNVSDHRSPCALSKYHSFQNHYTHKTIIFKLFRSLQLQFSGPTGIHFRYSYSSVGLTGIVLYSYSSVELHKEMVRGMIFRKLQLQLHKKWFSN